MKKLIIWIIIFCLASALCACNSSNLNSSGVSSDSATMIIKQYTWDGWGILSKEITGAFAQTLMESLDNLQATEEYVKKISDRAIQDGSVGIDLPTERGTMWIEARNKIYRIKPDYSQICLVESHLGKGQILILSEQCRTEIHDAWFYWPYDCWDGIYENGKLDVYHRYAADTNITAAIKNIYVENTDDPENFLRVELLSSIDQSLSISLICQQSDDNLARGDRKEVSLKAGEPQELEMTFGGFRHRSYYVTFLAGNTKLYITIHLP